MEAEPADRIIIAFWRISFRQRGNATVDPVPAAASLLETHPPPMFAWNWRARSRRRAIPRAVSGSFRTSCAATGECRRACPARAYSGSREPVEEAIGAMRKAVNSRRRRHRSGLALSDFRLRLQQPEEALSRSSRRRSPRPPAPGPTPIWDMCFAAPGDAVSRGRVAAGGRRAPGGSPVHRELSSLLLGRGGASVKPWRRRGKRPNSAEATRGFTPSSGACAGCHG